VGSSFFLVLGSRPVICREAVKLNPLPGVVVIFLLTLTGCITIADINDSLRRVDRLWQLEYQRTEDEYRYRVIEADSATAYRAVRLTFLDLGLAVQKESTESPLFIRAESEAPTPLSKEEWLEVRRLENPKLSDTGWLWSMGIVEDPSDYIVTMQATMKSSKNSTFVILDYTLDSPKLRRLGINPNKYAPPTAVRLACEKFWNTLADRLETMKIRQPRRRTKEEFEI
jgi:hypothetical protein